MDSVAYMYMRTGSVTVCGEVMKIDIVTSCTSASASSRSSMIRTSSRCVRRVAHSLLRTAAASAIAMPTATRTPSNIRWGRVTNRVS